VTATILVVEDENIIAYDIKECLENSGYTVPAVAAYGKQAIEKAAEFHPDLVLMDVMLKGDMNGIEAAEKIVSQFNIPVVYLTAYSDKQTLQKASNTQPFGYIIKPFLENQLITTVEIALHKHQTELVIREALEKEKENREIKSKFISMLSHEFRNPLSNILTLTEILTSPNYQLSEPKKNDYLLQIQKSVKHLDSLLSDVLLISKSEICKHQFNPLPLDLEDFCKNLISAVQVGIVESHEIILSIQGSCTLTKDNTDVQDFKNNLLPNLDEKLLYHILTNLLSNAIKYSPQGGKVLFDLFCVQGEAIFRIQDEGIGIPPADQECLFSSFHRGSNVGNIPGNGLGLVIVKHYVELHGGEISFASKEGVGTTFIVSLPLCQCSK
jgi:signal transduction histidine kinase